MGIDGFERLLSKIGCQARTEKKVSGRPRQIVASTKYFNVVPKFKKMQRQSGANKSMPAKDSDLAHLTVPSKANPASRSEITNGAAGQSMPIAGSSQRTPLAASGT